VTISRREIGLVSAFDAALLSIIFVYTRINGTP
jgi:hypothetical protein